PVQSTLSQSFFDKNDLISTFSTSSRRIEYREYLANRTKEISKLKLNLTNEKKWISYIREISNILFKSDKIFYILNSTKDYLPNGTSQFQKSFIDAALALYPNQFTDLIYNLYKDTDNSQVFGSSVFYLLNNNRINEEEALKESNLRFNKNFTDPLLKNLKLSLSDSLNSVFSNQPPLVDLFSNPFQKDKTIIFSLHRKNRKYHGITIIRKPDMTFLRNKDSTIFYVPQLALSITNLPGFFPQGNTPQGIFSIVGYYISPTETIGPTPNVLTRIPFEVSTEIFYHKEVKSTKWYLNDYTNLLPDSWKNYFPIYESFYAGLLGRRLIVMHGSADDPDYFRDQVYYPLTPSRGCLTTIEIWSELNGKCIESDQIKLINGLISTNQLYGFLVVIELNNEQKPVNIEEISKLIEKAETISRDL
ncbi:hypothetical protein ACFLS9_10840, partial [Bacteroidota bacterium]